MLVILSLKKSRNLLASSFGEKPDGKRFQVSYEEVAGSRRSDSGARAKNKASDPSFFPALSLALVFARAPLSKRLEQANEEDKRRTEIAL